jgi:hypothetical protein
MANVIAVKNEALPVRATKKVANAFAAVLSQSGFDVLSIKSKVFTRVSGDIKETINNDDGEPARNIETVIVAVNPHKSKVYYKGGYTEGSTDKPLCYSNNGIGPEADAQEPQAKKCATCPHNVFGSKITESGKKAKACGDSMRIAVAPADLSTDPMLLRVPAATLALLGQYGAFLAGKGYEPHEVVTRIGFDYTVAYPALTFKAVGFIEEGCEVAEKITALKDTDLVKQIIGVLATPGAEDVEAEQFELPVRKVAEVKVEAAPKVEKPKAVAKPVVEDEDDLPVEPKKVKVETKAKVDVAEEVGAMVESADDLDFDD